MGSFVFGTDGRGADTLMVTEGGARSAEQSLQPRKRKRWPSKLVMDGPEIVKFTLDVVPPMIDRVLETARWTRDDVELYLMHQATYFMLDHLRERLAMSFEKIPLALNDYGNTVSSTLPILIHDLRAEGRLKLGTQTMLIGFGVGLSWAGCVWTESWQPVSKHLAGEQTNSSRVNSKHAASNGHDNTSRNGLPAHDSMARETSS